MFVFTGYIDNLFRSDSDEVVLTYCAEFGVTMARMYIRYYMRWTI